MKKIIITPLFGMGDTLMTTPALEVLKKHRPEWEITFFTFSTGTYEIMQQNPHIDNLLYSPIKVKHFLKDIFYVIKNFTFRFDTVINFYPSNRIAYNLFALMTGAPHRLGHRYLHKNISQLNWLKNKTIPENFKTHCVEENIALLSFFNIYVPYEDIPLTKIYLTDREKKIAERFRNSLPKGTVVGIHPGTSTFKNHEHRRWPKEKFIELINTFPDVHFVLFGIRDEREVNRFIQASVAKPDQITIIGENTIREVAAIIGQLNGFVSNDSGLMHIAAAMQTPVVAILGPTNQNFIHPWKSNHTIVSLTLSCSPCFYYSPRPLTCSRIQKEQFKCLRELEPSQVAQALNNLLKEK